jgi:hypothetical protein
LQLKVLVPALLSRMKQGYNVVRISGFRVRGRDIGSLLEVTTQTTQAEIAPLIRPHVLLGDDVIDLMWKNGGALR